MVVMLVCVVVDMCGNILAAQEAIAGIAQLTLPGEHDLATLVDYV
jgi:hypothetical protein